MEEIKNAIAKNLCELRKRKNMTQADLAEQLNYSDKAVSKWERAESVPDISVLKAISDIFGVTVDYLITEEHDNPNELRKKASRRKLRNRSLITGISILLVWFFATFAFLNAEVFLTSVGRRLSALSFVYAVPISCVVWLVFNSIWFNRRRNFLIITLLMWSALVSFVLSFYLFGIFGSEVWKLLFIGVPAQIIIAMWSGIKTKRENTAKK